MNPYGRFEPGMNSHLAVAAAAAATAPGPETQPAALLATWQRKPLGGLPCRLVLISRLPSMPRARR
ncbi:hypothetical protein GCM10010303_83890 [Streptomyces purpurascens]|nr:hypothetical protein GCM10010303_83890 [Streptomyces purpurascens]